MFLGSSPFGYIFTQAKSTQANAAATATLTIRKSSDLLTMKIEGLVEAAGVEPASEKVYRERLRAFPIRWF